MWKVLVNFLKASAGIVLFIIGSFIYFQEWIIDEVKAVIEPEIRNIKEIRNIDMEHIDKRFDRIEKLIMEKK